MLITALVWDINFRLTFKNMNGHIDLGCYPSLKFDPLVVLIKNISGSVLFLLLYYISKKFSTSEKGPDKLLVVKTIGSSISYHFEKEKDLFLGSLVKYHNLYNKNK